ncbi:hypothetical protein [Isobaculum melis]|uniref:Uncharacterized protein n=1 Tax=Isobaculum melis TaxID=142588 RepID=A0A1H9S5H1_9LACT|nr:hypothetical protein [Isobaculum melis]SER79399.1 hypothetical protein SAMN04488559_10673 [Isobaculum melis]
MVDGKKNESGLALVSVLGIIILIAAMVGSIFFIARIVFFQVEKVDQFTRIKEVEEYALQDGANQIQQKISDYLFEQETIDFGQDITGIGTAIDSLLSNYAKSEEEIGSQDQFSYTLSIKGIHKEKVTPYVLVNNTGSFGWEKDTSIMNKTNATNVKLTFDLEAIVTEKEQNGQETTATATSQFCYEIQWNDVDVANELTELDVWRNVVYSYNIPNGALYLSADSWIKKMEAVYHYNSKPSQFDYIGFDNQHPHVAGYMNGQVVDITDGRVLDFSTSGKKIYSSLSFRGSLLLENGIQIEGDHEMARLKTNNLLALRTKNHEKNFIKKLDIQAASGSYIDLNGQESYLAMIDTAFDTSGLLINHTPMKNDKSTGGFLFGSGKLHVQLQHTNEPFSFANYLSHALQKSPQDEYWNEFLKGSMVIASANFYAGPVSLSDQIQSTVEQDRRIRVSGNFMLTSAMLESDSEGKRISYFEKESTRGVSDPNAPSTLTLDGPYTDMYVDGKSFIDAPKTSRRKSPSESDFIETPKFYGSQNDWNSIHIKNGASMYLNYTGIEPFNLTIEKDSIFSAKVLPDLAFFDTTFLFNSVSAGKLKGKVILQTFNQKDANTLKDDLKSQHIPVSTATYESDAKNGEVTIIKPDNPAGSGSSQIISRTFYYVDKVDY